MNAMSPPPRPAAPLVVPSSRSARRLVHLLAGLTVVGPLTGTVLALVLAVRYGVSASAWWIFAVTFILTGLGISMGFHRHFTHRAFKTSRPLSIALLILGSMAMEGSLLFWVASHRRHHQFSDTGEDPHSPYFKQGKPLGWWRGLYNSHVGWMFVGDLSNALRFAPDLIRDHKLMKLQGYYVSWILLGLAIPTLAGLALTGTAYGALEGLLWGGAVRMFIVHHADWAVGSFSHMYGQRPFRNDDHSANNWIVAFFSFGEGLQNNHHAFPTMARHALEWWEPDFAGWVITACRKLGVIWDVKHPSPQAVAARRQQALMTQGTSP